LRKIKVRAWDKNYKRMIFDIQNSYDGVGPEEPFDNFGSALNNENWYIVEEYVGINDIEDNAIYEGDIVDVAEYKGDFSGTGVVSFKNGGFYIKFIDDLRGNNIKPIGDVKVWVVGNIHENKIKFNVE
jgi:hypothetical protein